MPSSLVIDRLCCNDHIETTVAKVFKDVHS